MSDWEGVDVHPSDGEGMGQDLHPRYPNTKMRELGGCWESGGREESGGLCPSVCCEQGCWREYSKSQVNSFHAQSRY